MTECSVIDDGGLNKLDDRTECSILEDDGMIMMTEVCLLTVTE
jgi:hypothetical protein